MKNNCILLQSGAQSFFLVLFIFLFSLCSYGQLTCSFSTQTITQCSVPKQFNLVLSNGNATDVTALEFHLQTAEGIQLENFTSAASISSSVNNLEDYTLTVQNVPAGQSVSILFDTKANCSATQGSINLANSNTSFTGSTATAFTVVASSNGDLELPAVDDPSWDLSSHKGVSVSRQYVLTNNSGSTFTGFLRFHDTPKGALTIQNITVLLPGASSPISYTNGDVLTMTNVVAGAQIIFTETIMVSECITTEDDTSTGLSIVRIQRGCLQNDFCRTSIITPIINDDGKKFFITQTGHTPEKTSSFYSCFGGASQHRTVTYKNTGELPASDIMFVLNSGAVDNYIVGKKIDPASVRVRIYGTPARDKIYTVNRVSQNQPPLNNGLGSFIDYNQHRTLQYLKDCIVPINQIGGYTNYFKCDAPCNDISLIRLLITDLTEVSSSVNTKITIAPDELVEISWDDENMCFLDDYTSQKSIALPNIWVYGTNGCSSEMIYLQQGINGDIPYGFQNDNIQGAQVMLPFNPTMGGNADRCTNTFDGEIQSFSILNKQFNLFHQSGSNWNPSDLSEWGNVEIVLKLDPGLDLDLALLNYKLTHSGNTMVENYDHEACSKKITACTTCVASNIWNPSSSVYRIKFTHPQYGDWNWDNIQPLGVNTDGSFSYKIVFRLEDLYNNLTALLSSPTPPITQADLDNLGTLFERVVGSSELDFDLRAYCSNNAVSSVFETMYYAPPCAGGCSVAMAKLDFLVQVNCPGCKVPGMNLSGASFQREDQYLGYEDVNPEDGVPDNNNKISNTSLKMIATNGDVMESIVTMSISDGDAAIGGFTGQQMKVNKGIKLDHIYLSYHLTDAVMLDIVNANAAISIDDGTTWHTLSTQPVKQTGNFLFKIPASDLGLLDFHDYFDTEILVKSYFKVNPDILETGRIPKMVYVDYFLYASDCDNCSGDGSGFVSSAADNTTLMTCMNDPGCTTNLANHHYFCTGGKGAFSFVPTESKLQVSFSDAGRFGPPQDFDGCAKVIGFNSNVDPVNDGNILTNVFPKEYRPFMDNNETITYSGVIPPGYRVRSGIIYSGVPFNGQYTEQTYVIQNPDSYIQNPTAYNTARDFELIVGFTRIANGSTVQTLTEPYSSSKKILIGDEKISTSIGLYLEPADCASTPDGIAFEDQNIYYSLPHTSTEWPRISISSDLPGFSAGEFIPTNRSGESPAFIKPKTTLSATSQTQISLNNGEFLLPIRITNTEPLDENDDPIIPFTGGVAMSSSLAKYPYLYIEDIAALRLKGVEILGVYEGNNSTQGENFLQFNSGNATGFAYLKQGGVTALRPSSVNDYSLVLRYCMPSGCASIVDCNIADNNLPDCIKEIKVLKIQYGWNCENYPTNLTQLNNACYKRSMADINISNSAIAFNYGIPSTIGPVDLCNEFEYTASVQSCKAGAPGALKFSVDLPDGVVLAANGSEVTFKDGSDPNSIPVVSSLVTGNIDLNEMDLLPYSDGPFHGGDLITLKLKLKVQESRNTTLTQTIGLDINTATYCGLPIEIPAKNTTLTIEPALQGLNTQYCIHAASDIISADIPAANPDGDYSINTLAGLTDNNDGSATFDPSLAGTGLFDITYITTTTPSCTAHFEVTVYDGVTVNITPPGNTAAFLCSGSPGVPLVATTNPSGTFDYLWSYSVDNNPSNYSALSTGINTHNATIQGFYKVTLDMGTSGCTSTEAIYEVVNNVIVDEVDPVCREDNPPIKLLSTASGNPVLGTYLAQWYRLSDNALMSNGIPAEGDYYAVAISNITTPSCTLSTVSMPSHISIKQTPQPYEIKFGGGITGNYVLHCPVGSSGIPLEVTNASRSINSGYTNPTEIVWNDQPQTTYTNGIPGDVVVNYGGTFSLAIEDTETGCIAKSNELHIGTPQISVYPSCGSNGTDINLNVYANYPTTGASYTWKKVTAPGATPIIDNLGNGTTQTVSEADRLYTVESSFQGCPTGDGFYLPTTIPFNVGTSINGIENGNFVGLGGTDCLTDFTIDFDTDFLCQTDKDADPLDKIGHLMINGAADADGASLWNQYWTGTAHNSSSLTTGNEFMLVDGTQSAGDQLVWRREVPVDHAYRYFARASIRNIAMEDQTPVREIPEIWMHVIYKGQSVSHLYTSQGQVIQTTSLGTDPWVEFGTFAVADVKHNASPATKGEAETVEISIFMKGRGAIGRDVGVDDVELWPVGLCDNLSTVVPVSPCSGISIADPNLLVCPGGQATVTINNPNPDVTYDYYEAGEDPSTSQLATLDASNSFLAPVISGTFQSYTLAVSGAGCTTKLSFNVRAIDPPQLTIVSVADANSCNNTKFKVLVNGVEDNTRTYVWRINNNTTPEGETSLLFTSSTLTNGNILSCSIANYNQCGSTTSPVANYTISSNTFTANAGTDQTICLGTAATIGLAAVSGRIYEWRSASVTQPNSNPIISISAQPQLSPTTTANYELTVINTTSGCSSKDEVTVTVNSLPTVSAGNDQTVCSGSSITLSGSGAQSYTWNQSVTNGASFTPTTTTTYAVSGTDVNGCENTDEVLVTIKPVPVITTTTPSARCGSGTLILAASASAGDIKWYSALTGGTLLYTGDSYTTSSISTTTTYYVEAFLDGCSSIPRTAVVATIGTVTPTITGTTSAARCSTGTVTLEAVASAGDVKWYSVSTGGTVLYTGVSYITSEISATTNYFVEASLNGCTTSARTQVTATVNPLPPNFTINPVTTSVCPGSPVVIEAGSALDFNNTSNAIVTIPSSASLSPTTAITVAGWVRTTSTNEYIISQQGGYYLVVGHVAGNSKAGFYLQGVSNLSWLLGTTNLNDGVWHHLVGTYDAAGGTNNLKVYVDGTLQAQRTATGTIATSVTNVEIGARTSLSTYMNGRVDEVGVWNRVLSPTEITALLTNSTTPSSTGLKGFWNIEEGSGTTISDISGNGNTGTLGSAVTWVRPGAPLSYTWSPSGSPGNTLNVAPTNSTTYIATLTSGGCSISCSSAVTVNSCREGLMGDEEIVESIKIAPNPSEDNFNLTIYSLENKLVEMVVHDVNGKIIETKKINTNEAYLFGSNYSAGIYIVKVNDGGIIKTYKVVKIK